MVEPEFKDIKEELLKRLKEHVNEETRAQHHSQSLQNRSVVDFAQEYSESKHTELIKTRKIFFEALHDLFTFRIIARGEHMSFFFITERGIKLLLDQDFDIYESDAYISNLPQLDDITTAYIKESISSFNSNLFISSIVTLGIASESLVLDIARTLQTKSGDTNLNNLLQNINTSISTIINKIDSLCSGKVKGYDSYYKPSVYGTSNLIRNYRNQYNHPQLSSVNVDDIRALLITFKGYSKTMIELKNEINITNF